MFSLSNFGMTAYIGKFFPYYKDHLSKRKNDMLTWSLIVNIIGFTLVTAAGWIFRDLVIRKYGQNSPELIQYYRWVFPFGFGLAIYSLLEAYAWQLQRSVLTNYLREVQFRLFTTILIVLTLIGWINDFDLFIKLYSFTYLLLAGLLFFALYREGNVHFTFSASKVTRRYFSKIVTLVTFIWSGSFVFMLSNIFDTLVIAAVLPNGLANAGIYTLAQYIASLIQAPQRGIASSSIRALSQAWKDKDMRRISSIYHGSSINQIIFAAGMFVLIWINFADGVLTFHLQKDYINAKEIFLYIGLMRIIDMGTGLNAQIIGTSTYWRFDFITGIILFTITIPLNYLLTKTLGVTGPAISNLLSFSIYNGIRYLFLLKKFRLQPFNGKSGLAILWVLICYFIWDFLFSDKTGILWILVRSSSFVFVYVAGVILLNLSNDVLPVWKTIQKRLGIAKKP
jgi:O-antigen/teichoic acid export membrane protein